MYAFFWKQFPIFYMLPFLMATVQFPSVAAVGESLRWALLLIGCVIAASCGFKRAGRKYNAFTWADKAIVAFLLLFLLSELWTIQPGVTAQRAISMILLYGCSFWTFWAYADQFSERVLLKKLLKTLGLVFFVNLLSGAILPNAWLAGRFRGMFINPNNIGLILGLAVPLIVSQWLYCRQKVFVGTIVVFSFNLLACGSRSAMLGAGVAFVVTLISLSAKRSSQAVLIALLAAFGMAYLSQTDFFIEHVLREDSLLTASNRTHFWTLAKTYISQRPDLGHGFGTDGAIHSHYGVVLRDLQLRGFGVMSSYYGLAVQIGWPFTYCFFGLMWGFITYCCVKHWQNSNLMSLIAPLVSGLVIGFFEPAITSAGNIFSFFFWMILMLAVRQKYYQRRGLMGKI